MFLWKLIEYIPNQYGEKVEEERMEEQEDWAIGSIWDHEPFIDTLEVVCIQMDVVSSDKKYDVWATKADVEPSHTLNLVIKALIMRIIHDQFTLELANCFLPSFLDLGPNIEWSGEYQHWLDKVNPRYHKPVIAY